MTEQSEVRYVVDVSDLVHWYGNLSGIQRVVAEMAYRYEALGATFCYYDESEQTFFPLGTTSFSEFMENRHSPRVESIDASEPSGYRTYAKKIVDQVAPPVTVRAAKKAKRVLTQSRSREAPIKARFAFMAGDVLLIFGAHWDKPHYTEVLAGIKSEVRIRVAHLIHDLIPIFDQGHVAEVEHVRFPKYMREISRLADVIYLTSKASVDDYEKFLNQENIPSPEIRLVRLGENFTVTKQTKPHNFNQTTYILAVGTIEVRKNYGLLYATYKRAAEHGIELPPLVIVGRQGWLSGDIYYQMVHDPATRTNIQFLHHASDGELSWLYEHCLFTVFPSFYEGWGLPVAEAAHYGKVTASSDKSSLPEVVGDGAAYFSPFSADECLDTLVSLLDVKNRAEYEKILAKRTPITWDEAFEATRIK